MARISTSRTVDLLYGPDGTALAEFCDDTVTAPADADGEPVQQWREWELELAGGRRVATCWSGWPTGSSMPARNPRGTARSWRGCSSTDAV